MKKTRNRVIAIAIAMVTLLSFLALPLATREVSAEEDGETIVFNIYKRGSWPAYPVDGGEGHQLLLDTMREYGVEGVDFKVTHISGDEYYDKLNALAAIDDLPDYFSNNMLNLKNFADQGLLLPLEDQLENLPVAYEMMRETDLQALTYDGHLYALPVAYLDGPLNGPNVSGYAIRQDWLDNLGLDVPETIEELEAVLEAFTTQDPDGNGEDDTYGYIGVDTTEFDQIFGAYGVLPTFWQEGEDGQVILGATKPETKEVLALLADWYAKGYIDPDIFTNDYSLQDQKLANSKGGIYEGSGFTLDPANPEHAALLAAKPDAKLSPIPPLKGPEGLFGAYESSPGYGNINSVNADVEHVDKLMEMLNWFTDPGENGGMYLASVGIEGEHYVLHEDTDRIEMLGSYDDVYAAGLGNPVRFLQVVDRRWGTDEMVHAFETFAPMYQENLFWGTTDSMVTYPDTCKELFRSYLQRIVMGALPVEEGYQQFLDEFEDMGGLQITEEVNAAIKEMVEY